VSHPVFYTSFAGTSTTILTRDMELSQDSAQHSIGAAAILGYSTLSLRVAGRDGSRRLLVAILRAGQVSQVYDFADTYCGSAPPDFA
jgi:predicted ATP-grasp superfamily ATP-dependent carboligase